MKEKITQYLQQNPDCGELAVFSHPGALDAFFNPLLEINRPAHDSKELSAERFTLGYTVRYAKRPPIILPPHFRQIRYYGVLANGANKELLPMVFAALSQEQQTISFENWRERENRIRRY